MSAFKHFDVARYLEDAKSEAEARPPAKTAKAAKEVATLAGLAGVQADGPGFGGPPGGQPGSAAATTSSDPFDTEIQPKATSGSVTPATSAPPADWVAAAANLQQMDRPATVSEERWQEVRSDAARLLDWVPMLASLDWTPEDVYGRDDLDRKFLAWLVNGQRIGPVTKIAAVLRGTDGSTTWIYRHDSADSSDSADSPSPEANRPTPETPRVGTAKTDKRWDPETTALIEWLLKTEPPVQPFKLQQAVTIAHPDNYWEYLRQDIAAGPGRARGKTGAFKSDLRQLYRVLHDGKDIGGGTA